MDFNETETNESASLLPSRQLGLVRTPVGEISEDPKICWILHWVNQIHVEKNIAKKIKEMTNYNDLGK